MIRICSLLLVLVALLPDLATAAQADLAAAPKLGRYNIRSYGASNRPPLFLGHFILEDGGKYKVFLPGGREVGGGTYEFDASKMEVVWLTGKYKEEGWGGAVQLASDEKTTVIVMKSTTRATHVPDDAQ